jgi:hypothetical protein
MALFDAYELTLLKWHLLLLLTIEVAVVVALVEDKWVLDSLFVKGLGQVTVEIERFDQ